ncbi:MAG: YfhO family protein [Chitinispirillia bacterium]|nr:YfhO family protein [Chitinispirillia bacterium]MCL2242788.1 YfhO family protein [Chitinispirillia bacterium]
MSDHPTVPGSKPADAPALAAAEVKKPFRHGDLICVAAFFVIVTIIFSQFIFSGDMLTASDQMSAVGVRQYLSVSLTKYGQMPMWEAGRLGGMPTVDAVYGDAFYPVTGVLRPFLPAYRFFGFTMILHIFLAGVFFFFMLRRSFGAARITAFAGALFYMLSPQFVSLVSPGHDGKMFVIAWLPFVIWRLRSLMAVPVLRNAGLLAVGVAAMVLTSHMQLTYFVCMGIFLYWAADLVKGIAAKEDKKRVAFKAAYFWAGVFTGIGVACVMIYPSYMFLRDAFSVRGVDRGFEFAASWSMNWAEFFSLWVYEFGNSLQYYWGKNFFKLNTEYAGAIPLLLAFLAVASKPKSFWRIFWAGIAVLAVLYALGANTPFFTAAYHIIPGVKRFRAPSMIMFWFSFATALMAAFFIKDLLSKRFEIFGRQQQRWTAGLWAALGGVTLLTILFSVESVAASFAAPMMGGGDADRVFAANFKQKFIPALWLWWLFVVVTLGMLIAVVNGKVRGSTLVYALIIMGTIDMVKVNGQFIKVESPWKYYYRDDAALRELKAGHEKVPFRVFSLPRTFATENQEAFYGLEGVGGFHDNELNCYRAFRGDQRDLQYLADIAEISRDGNMRLSRERIEGNTPFLDLAGVNYILMASGSGGISKIKNPTSLGRLSYAADYVVMEEDNIISALRREEYNYRTTAALLEEPELPFTRGESVPAPVAGVDDNAGGIDNDSAGVDTNVNTNDIAAGEKHLKVEWKKYTPNKRVASVTMPADGFLRISEVYYPGWRIEVDGAPVKYYRADMAWMAVPLKAGSYEVVMMPKSLYLGGAMKISAIFTVILALMLFVGLVRGKRVAGGKNAERAGA